MVDYVDLRLMRNRGWPWPEDSWGLTPMFGDDGWCRSCGVPLREQVGSIVLRGMKRCDGAWVPYWQYDVVCLAGDVADEVRGRLSVDLLPVEWKGPPPGRAEQIVIPSTAEAWFDPQELAARLEKTHGATGAECRECGTWVGVP